MMSFEEKKISDREVWRHLELGNKVFSKIWLGCFQKPMVHILKRKNKIFD